MATAIFLHFLVLISQISRLPILDGLCLGGVTACRHGKARGFVGEPPMDSVRKYFTFSHENEFIHVESIHESSMVTAIDPKFLRFTYTIAPKIKVS